jgi:hypothetical protein
MTASLTPDTVSLASASRPQLSVYDGQVQLGCLVRRGAAFEAIDINGMSHGIFHDMKTAAFNLPTRSEP